MVTYLSKKSYLLKNLKEVDFNDLWGDRGIFTTMWIYNSPPKILFFENHLENLLKSLTQYKLNKPNLKKNILFWITGLSGAGKTSIAKAIKSQIIKRYGPTLLVNGDDLRNLFKLKKYDRESRLTNATMFHKFAKFITNQNINLIFAVVGLFDEIRNLNRKNIENYVIKMQKYLLETNY